MGGDAGNVLIPCNFANPDNGHPNRLHDSHPPTPQGGLD
jgi:hypothetical protein